jgi:hypothetical protein
MSAPGYTPYPRPRAPEVSTSFIGDAFNLFKEHWVTYLLIAIPGVLVIGGTFLYPFWQVFQAADPEPSPFDTTSIFQSIGLSIFQGLVITLTYAVFAHIGVRHLRGETPSFDMVGEALVRAIPLAFASFFISVLVAVGTYCCCLPGLILSGLFSITPPIVTMLGKGPIDAMSLSFDTLKPQLWPVTYLIFLTSLIVGLSFLTVLLPLLTMPLYGLVVARLYHEFLDQPSAPIPAEPLR